MSYKIKCKFLIHKCGKTGRAVNFNDFWCCNSDECCEEGYEPTDYTEFSSCRYRKTGTLELAIVRDNYEYDYSLGELKVDNGGDEPFLLFCEDEPDHIYLEIDGKVLIDKRKGGANEPKCETNKT